MTSCGRRCRGASASTSTNRCHRWIVWIAYFSVGVERARRVRGERPLYTTEYVREKGFVLLTACQLHKYAAGRGGEKGKTNLPGQIVVPKAGIPTPAYKFGFGFRPGAFFLVPCCRTKFNWDSGVENETTLPIGWGVPSLFGDT